MRIIEKLSDMISEELDDAEKYAKCAIEYKDSDKQLAALFYELSNEEMSHMNRLHDAVTRIIAEYRAKSGEPPADMMAVYEYLHGKQISHATQVKMMQSLFK